ncbi:K+ channel protein [Pelomyxa schiedti]|nr:K+ channel protein [Pelomyxa schiedti]
MAWNPSEPETLSGIITTSSSSAASPSLATERTPLVVKHRDGEQVVHSVYGTKGLTSTSQALRFASHSLANDLPPNSFGKLSSSPPLTNKLRLVSRRQHQFNIDVQGRKVSSKARTLYHSLLELTWWKLFLMLLLGWGVMHLFFGLLFFCGGPESISEMGDQWDAQFYFNCVYFSVQAGATIGFGRWSPITNWANIVVSMEAFLQLTWSAVITGFVFSKISRPSLLSRQILFSEYGVVTHTIPYFHASQESPTSGTYHLDDKYPCLAFRIVNPRHSMMIMPLVRLFLIRSEPVDGVSETAPHVFRTHELNYELNQQLGRVRSTHVSSPYLPLPYTVFHVLDTDSPLYGVTPEQMAEMEGEFVLIIEGSDESCSNNFQARYSYLPCDILWNHHFLDMVQVDPISSKFILHLELLSATVEDTPPHTNQLHQTGN